MLAASLGGQILRDCLRNERGAIALILEQLRDKRQAQEKKTPSKGRTVRQLQVCQDVDGATTKTRFDEEDWQRKGPSNVPMLHHPHCLSTEQPWLRAKMRWARALASLFSGFLNHGI